MSNSGAKLGPQAGVNKATPTAKLKTLRLHRKDFKKGGDALRGKNVTEGYRVKEKDMKRTMKWRTPEISMKNLKRAREKHKSGHDSGAKHERPREPEKRSHSKSRAQAQAYENDIDDNTSTDDMLDRPDPEEEDEIYRKISERRSEINRARRNGDDCHVSWYRAPASALELVGDDPGAERDREDAILLVGNDQLVAVCNGRSSSIERSRAKRSSKV